MARIDAVEGLIRAAAEAIRPIARRLLSTNVPFGRLEARLRELFVEVAEVDFPLANRPQTDSRIALLTGINRKEVHRIRANDGAKSAPMVFSRNRAAALISRWMANPQATDRAGRPLPIPYQSKRGPSFVRFAREAASDLPPRAILDELERTGAVRLRDGNLVELNTDFYVPALGRPELMKMLSEDPAELLETMLHNVFAEGDEPLLQRKVFYDNLGSEAAGRIRSELRRETEQFLRRVNRLLAARDRDRNPRAAGGERYGSGVGIYFFESPPPATNRKNATDAGVGIRRPKGRAKK